MIDDEQTVSVQSMLYFTLYCTLVVKLQKNKLTGTWRSKLIMIKLRYNWKYIYWRYTAQVKCVKKHPYLINILAGLTILKKGNKHAFKISSEQQFSYWCQTSEDNDQAALSWWLCNRNSNNYLLQSVSISAEDHLWMSSILMLEADVLQHPHQVPLTPANKRKLRLHLEMPFEFSVLKRLPQSPDLHPTECFWDVLDIINMHQTSLQDCVMLSCLCQATSVSPDVRVAE